MRTRRSLGRPKLVVENPGPAEQEQAAQTGQTTDTQSDTDDIEALWEDDCLGDPLTTTHVHNIPIDKPKDFFWALSGPEIPQEDLGLRPQIRERRWRAVLHCRSAYAG